MESASPIGICCVNLSLVTRIGEGIYDRTAYYEPDGDLRLTIDRNPRYRTDRLDFYGAPTGIPLLKAGETILEIKVQDTIPLWLVRILSEGRIRRGSISKYGEACKQELMKA